jgi:hypothetical protein
MLITEYYSHFDEHGDSRVNEMKLVNEDKQRKRLGQEQNKRQSQEATRGIDE